jgi:hypothetical protein
VQFSESRFFQLNRGQFPDIMDEQQRLMQRRVEYWSDLAAKGVALIFGPVVDPA